MFSYKYGAPTELVTVTNCAATGVAWRISKSEGLGIFRKAVLTGQTPD